MYKKYLFFTFLMFQIVACKKDDNSADTAAALTIKVHFDPNQIRLNNLGNPATIQSGNAAQTPTFHSMSVHYVELAQNQFTALGKGTIVYKAAETNKGGENAVDFDQAKIATDNQIFATISLKDLTPGTYEWVRASVTYQNYDILFNINDLPVIGSLKNQKGTLSSFVGFNTYISKVKPKNKELLVNDDKKQGFWAFETDFSAPYQQYNQLFSGEAPEGATTVVNPIASTSPIPKGSCVVTGKFAKPLVITGKEDKNINITLSFSINNSLEWQDTNKNGELDWYANQNAKNEKIVDMGLRGLIPSF